MMTMQVSSQIGEQPGGANTTHVLVVDDHADTARIMRRLLEKSGYRVTTAGSVGEAMNACTTARFDLLISDVGLPDGNGYDLMRQVKSGHGTRGIAVSGFGSDSDLESSRDAGFDAHITKPVDFEQLKAAIVQVLGSGQQARTDS